MLYRLPSEISYMGSCSPTAYMIFRFIHIRCTPKIDGFELDEVKVFLRVM